MKSNFIKCPERGIFVKSPQLAPCGAYFTTPNSSFIIYKLLACSDELSPPCTQLSAFIITIMRQNQTTDVQGCTNAAMTWSIGAA